MGRGAAERLDDLAAISSAWLMAHPFATVWVTASPAARIASLTAAASVPLIVPSPARTSPVRASASTDVPGRATSIGDGAGTR